MEIPADQPLALLMILHPSKVAQVSHATLFPAAQVTVPQLPELKLLGMYAVLTAAMMTSPQFSAWFGVSQGCAASNPLFESLPAGVVEALARYRVAAPHGSANKQRSEILS